MVPVGFDPITLNQRLCYKHQCHEYSPADFQRLFEDIIKRARSKFIAIKPYGDIGDKKCDGLLFVDGTVFQVYSPDELTQADLITKIEEDWKARSSTGRARSRIGSILYRAMRAPLGHTALDFCRECLGWDDARRSGNIIPFRVLSRGVSQLTFLTYKKACSDLNAIMEAVREWCDRTGCSIELRYSPDQNGFGVLCDGVDTWK